VTIAQAGVYEYDDLSQGYFYLNQLRVRAGMTELSRNSVLETAAFNHANFLADNLMTGHYESQGYAGFTGAAPEIEPHLPVIAVCLFQKMCLLVIRPVLILLMV
jgi:hypothetical protein